MPPQQNLAVTAVVIKSSVLEDLLHRADHTLALESGRTTVCYFGDGEPVSALKEEGGWVPELATDERQESRFVAF